MQLDIQDQNGSLQIDYSTLVILEATLRLSLPNLILPCPSLADEVWNLLALIQLKLLVSD